MKKYSFTNRVCRVLKRKMQQVRYGKDTPAEFVFFFVDQVLRVILNKNPNFYAKSKIKSFKNFIKDDAYHIKDVKLPLLDEEYQNSFVSWVFDDTFYSYLYCDDRYDEKTVDFCDSLLYEGLYGLQNDLVDVTVEPGDVVIDAGSWIGDFAAYASVRGAKVYAFEPVDKAYSYLLKTAQLNKNIFPVKKGVSDKTTNREIYFNEADTEASTFLKELCIGGGGTASVQTTSIDDFVREMNLEKVDFIKADIEGFERNMLTGAQDTLKRFAPKLALCTYHLPDDPEVMSSLIKQANPDYNIVLKQKKLYASVPNLKSKK